MCVDYMKFKNFIRREILPMAVTENVLGKLGKVKYFSELDANHGFWQFLLD